MPQQARYASHGDGLRPELAAAKLRMAAK